MGEGGVSAAAGVEGEFPLAPTLPTITEAPAALRRCSHLLLFLLSRASGQDKNRSSTPRGTRRRARGSKPGRGRGPEKHLPLRRRRGGVGPTTAPLLLLAPPRGASRRRPSCSPQRRVSQRQTRRRARPGAGRSGDDDWSAPAPARPPRARSPRRRRAEGGPAGPRRKRPGLVGGPLPPFAWRSRQRRGSWRRR